MIYIQAVHKVNGRYQQLWQVEKAFRISKTDLKIRPVFHQLPGRIDAHMCIAFAACKVFKELERQLQIKQAPISVHKAIEIAENIYQIQIQSPLSRKRSQKPYSSPKNSGYWLNYSFLGVKMRKSGGILKFYSTLSKTNKSHFLPYPADLFLGRF